MLLMQDYYYLKKKRMIFNKNNKYNKMIERLNYKHN